MTQINTVKMSDTIEILTKQVNKTISKINTMSATDVGQIPGIMEDVTALQKALGRLEDEVNTPPTWGTLKGE